MKNFGFIYITENLINGKKYIGQRSYSKKGWEEYLGSGKHLRRAIAKYGRENFVRTIIFKACSKEELNEAERRFISEHNAVEDPMYYNIVPGGHGCSLGFKGKKHSPETREKMRLASLGHPVAQHVKEAVSKAHKGKKLSPERCEQIKDVTPRGEDHFRSISVEIDGVVYPSITAAKDAGYSYRIVKDIQRGGDGIIPSRGRKGKTHHASQSIIINGITYDTISEAEAAGYSYLAIKKVQRTGISNDIKKTVGQSTRREVIIHGVHYSSISEAVRVLNSYYKAVLAMVDTSPEAD